MPEFQPLRRCEIPNFLCSIRLPETPAISLIASSAFPFGQTLNLLAKLVHNGHEVFGCWCSLFCQMFEASPRYSVESLRNCPGVNPVHASIVSGSLPGKDTKPKKRRTFHLLSPVKKIAGNRHVIS